LRSRCPCAGMGFGCTCRSGVGSRRVTAGLTLGIVAAAPQAGNPLPSLVRWVEARGAGRGGVAGRAAGARAVRASLYALAAVATLAAQSALLAATVALFKKGIVTALSTWQPYALGVVRFVALTLVQSAYQAGPLAASMRVMDAANPIVGIAIGLAVFDENVDISGWHLPGATFGVALLVTGVILLDTSPLVRRVQRIEEEEQRQASEDVAGGALMSNSSRITGTSEWVWVDT
jgi:hypothetical protein